MQDDENDKAAQVFDETLHIAEIVRGINTRYVDRAVNWFMSLLIQFDYALIIDKKLMSFGFVDIYHAKIRYRTYGFWRKWFKRPLYSEWHDADSLISDDGNNQSISAKQIYLVTRRNGMAFVRPPHCYWKHLPDLWVDAQISRYMRNRNIFYPNDSNDG